MAYSIAPTHACRHNTLTAILFIAATLRYAIMYIGKHRIGIKMRRLYKIKLSFPCVKCFFTLYIGAL